MIYTASRVLLNIERNSKQLDERIDLFKRAMDSEICGWLTARFVNEIRSRLTSIAPLLDYMLFLKNMPYDDENVIEKGVSMIDNLKPVAVSELILKYRSEYDNIDR